jgi:hypothetical protein
VKGCNVPFRARFGMGDKCGWSLAIFDPSHDFAEQIELIRPIAAAAMANRRQHIEFGVVASGFAEFCMQFVVIGQR